MLERLHVFICKGKEWMDDGGWMTRDGRVARSGDLADQLRETSPIS